MTKLSWDFELEDKASGPARRAASSINAARQALRGLNEDARRSGGLGAGVIQGIGRSQAQTQRAIATSNRQALAAMRATHASAAEMFGVFRSIGTAALSITGAAAGIGVAFAGVALQIGRSLASMIRFREGAVTTLGALLRPRGVGGGREMIRRTGAAAFRQTQDIARMTPANESGVIEARQQVAAAGFRGAEERRALAASLDVQALNPNRADAQQRFLIGLGQMRNKSRLSLQDINQTTEAAGIAPAEVQHRAAQLAGVTQRQGETDIAYQRRIESAGRSGQITGQHGVQAVYQTLSAQTGESLGGFARMQGNSLGGSLSNLDEAVSGLITSINNLENMPGVRAFSTSIAAIANALNGSSAAGQRLQASIAPIIDELGQMFGNAFSPELIEGVFSAIARVLPQVFGALKLFGGAFMTGLRQGLGPLMRPGAFDGMESLVPIIALVAESLGNIVGWAVRVTGALVAIGGVVVVLGSQFLRFVQWVSEIPASIAGIFTSLNGMWISLGTSIVDGLVGGLRTRWTSVTDEVSSLALSLPDTVRGALGIHSPSRVFMQLGANVSRGMAMGIEGGSGEVRSAVNGMVSTPGAGGIGGGRGITIGTLHIEAHGSNSAEIIDDIRAQLDELLGGVFDRAALAGGA